MKVGSENKDMVNNEWTAFIFDLEKLVYVLYVPKNSMADGAYPEELPDPR